ncbi:MAG TPA: SdpI family protein [Candidatus Syntrophosphaera sp.]|nr:SdpI family protein [Candidatus Syntrophosphaera sp.]
MMRLSKFKWVLLVLALHLAAVVYFMVALPAGARVPMHWNIENQIDGWAGKTTGLLVGIGTNVLLFLLIYLMPWYSPWYRKYQERNEAVLPALLTVLVAFFALISVYSLVIAKWGEIPGVNMILVLIGFLFIFMGNLLPKVPKNFFVGIRTPWTLTSDKIWQKTHRLGGICFVISGLIMIAKGFLLKGNQPFQVVTAVLAFAILLYPILYSFILYRKFGRD